ncbi:MAG: RNA 2',3'-cyclic phosphodiesterase [Verrucomicrobia bacterium]|nr:RNA 2',3'-cyclic phosphodiesterase [Verrucomicrobiota bacterium]
MSAAIRAFVALKVGGAVLDAVLQSQQALRDRVPASAVRWTPREQLHLTLRFLGQVPRASLPALTSALDAAAGVGQGLELELAGLGAFPSLRSPRVLWIGVRGDTAALARLQASVTTATASFGEPPESRRWHPHLTMGRVSGHERDAASRVGAALADQRVASLGRWRATQIHLVQSELLPAGARYTDVATFALVAETG